MVTPTAQTSITVSWDTNNKVTAYKLERAIAVTPTATPAWTQVAVVTPAPSSTTTSYPDPSRSCGTAYLYRVSAIGDGTDYSKFEYGDPSQPETASTDFYCVPQSLTVIPLPQRKAQIAWNPVAGATGYAIQVMKRGGVWSPPTPVADTSKDIELDSILAGEGLAHADAFHFRVQAVFPTPTPISAFSKTITVIDSPIVRVNGHSPTSTPIAKAVVTWKPPVAATAYYVRSRKLSVGQDHTAKEWQLDGDSFSIGEFAPGSPTPVPSPVPTPVPATMAHTIFGLERGALYAIQLNYLTDDGWVFSARDAYVWPSGVQPGPGKRVAGYPFVGHFPSRTYTYSICKDTFHDTNDTIRIAWADLIEHALGQWQKATGGFISMVRSNATCTTYPEFTPTTKPIDWWVEISSRLGGDDGLSEVRMVDPPSPGEQVQGSFIEMLLTDPFKACILYPDFVACASSHSGFLAPRQQASTTLPSADIIFNHDVIYAPPIATPTIGPNKPDDVVFNSCVDKSTLRPDLDDSQHQAYAAAVHEAGHALGLSGGLPWNITFALVASVLTAYQPPATPINIPSDIVQQVYEASHAGTTDAAMNYDEHAGEQEPDCAPHPLDVLAIMALYQSAPTPTPTPSP